jgi:hypothetical protein
MSRTGANPFAAGFAAASAKSDGVYGGYAASSASWLMSMAGNLFYISDIR